MEPEVLKNRLYHHKIYCWYNDPYAKGGYSYPTLYTEQAKKILTEPVYDTIYFAGEAVTASESHGTVEAALQSGKDVAGKLLENIK